jgi:hypothetical protein
MAFSKLLPRTFVSFALLTFGCVSLLAAVGETGNPILDATKPHGDRVDRAWKRYRNEDLGYCVSYPSRWMRGAAFDGSGLLVETGVTRFSRPTGEIDIGPLQTAGPEDARIKPAALTSENLDEVLREHLTGLQKFERAERLEVMEQRHIKVQGVDALYVKNKYYDPLERTTWMEEVVVVERNGELYRIELQCPPDQIKRFETVFTYLVNTFEFECGK